MLIAVKAPHGTCLEVPDPEEVGKPDHIVNFTSWADLDGSVFMNRVLNFRIDTTKFF